MSAAKCTVARVQGSGFRVQFFRPSRDQTWSRCSGVDADHWVSTWYPVRRTQYCRRAASHRALSTLLLLLLLLPAAVAPAAESFADKLSALAAKCDELGLKEQAALTRAWNIQRYPGRQYLFLPLVTDPTAPKSGGAETVT